MVDQQYIEWLLEGDPAIVYQTHLHLLDAKDSVLGELQSAIVEGGWCKDFLSYRDDATGLWGNGYYSPKWISTTYTMWDLRNFGISPRYKNYVESADLLIDNLWKIPQTKKDRYVDLCICGMLLHICCYAKTTSPKVMEIIDFVIKTQMSDGGWNCRLEDIPHHSSLHTTINILEGIQTYIQNGYIYRIDELKAIKAQAHEFILCHRLFKSDKTGDIIDKKMLMLSYPSRWRYDILRCMVYFADVKQAYDPRMADAISHILKKKRKDGYWPVQQKYTGLVYFDMEKTGGASRWNTLRVLKMLDSYGEDYRCATGLE